MSGQALPAPSTWFPLPRGFEADAVPFAARTSLALLLGYGLSFAIQLDTAASTGLCIAIVAQTSPGMALSKAAWRTAGTLIGGVVGVALVAAFAQDRTMLLGGFTLWLGACTFVAALLRDFRSYGAVLSGYTVGIIAVGNIDTPDTVFLSALNRVAAILIGVGCVALVNTLFSPPAALRGVLRQLDEWQVKIDALADDALAGRPIPGSTALAEAGGAILALRAEAGYAALEVPGGQHRRHAAAEAIVGLLGVLSATRGLGNIQNFPPGPARDVFRAERIAELARQRGFMQDGLQALHEQRPPRQVVQMHLYQDGVGAWLNALRTMIAVALGSAFCVIAGWPGATTLLIQQAAFTALFGMQPNPTAAAIATGATLPLAVLAVFIIDFLLLPQASGFIPFALALLPFAFAFALVARHRKLGRFSPTLMLYLTLLLSPANTQQFDLGEFSQNVFVQVIALVFMVAAFTLILPVSPERRLMRVVDDMGQDLRRALHGKARLRPIEAGRSLRYDRLAAAQRWMGRSTPARTRVLERMGQFEQLEGALLRAKHGLRQLGRPLPAPNAGAIQDAVASLLTEPTGPAVQLAISGLYEASLLLQAQGRALRHYGILPDVA